MDATPFGIVVIVLVLPVDVEDEVGGYMGVVGE